MEEQMTIEEAKDFFAEFYHGEHHIREAIERFGYGYMIRHSDSLSTFDFNELTRFVLMCHDRAYRGTVQSRAHKHLSLCIWKRKRQVNDGEPHPIWATHPTIEDATALFRKHSVFHKRNQVDESKEPYPYDGSR